MYTLSRYAGVLSRFMAVASQYGIHSLRHTVGTVKFAVWKFLTETVHIYMCLFCLNAVLYFGVCVLCVLCFLHSGVINK